MTNDTKVLAEQSKADKIAADRAKMEQTMTDSLVKLLPRQVDPTRFTAFALAILRSTELRDCTEKSKLLALSDCAKMGLFPDRNLGHVYLIPFNNKSIVNGKTEWHKEVTVIAGYQGMIELARRSGFITTIHTGLVCEGDEFSYWTDEEGPHLRHVPTDDPDDEKIEKVYCVATLAAGGRQIEVMTIAQVEKVRQSSKTKDKGPWKTDYPMMVRKTVVRRARKYWPQSPELARLGALDDVADGMYERKHVDNIAAGALASAPTGRLDTKPEPTPPPVDDQWGGKEPQGDEQTTPTEPKPQTQPAAKTEETKTSAPTKEKAPAGSSAEPATAEADAIPTSADGRQQWLARLAMTSAGWDDEQMATAIIRRWLLTNQVAPSQLNKDAIFNPTREQIEKIDWKPAFDEWASEAEKAAAKEGASTQ
jgi:recombination protein RecT